VSAPTATTQPAIRQVGPHRAAGALAPVLPGVPTPTMPGPRLFGLIRIVLVLLTLIATAVGVAATLAAEDTQHQSAVAMVHAQDLRDLRTAVAAAQATALACLADPAAAKGECPALESANQAVDAALLASAASAAQHTGVDKLTATATTLRHWQSAAILAVATRDAQWTTGLTTGYDALAADLFRATAGGSAGTTVSAMEPVAIVVAVIALLAFLGALVVVARRSHRVINIGLAVGLLAVIGIMSILGVHTGRSAAISAADARIADLGTAQAAVWDARSANLAGLLTPAQWPDLDAAARADLTTAQSLLAPYPTAESRAAGLLDAQQQLTDATDVATRTPLVLDATPWNSLTGTIADTTNSLRPDQTQLVIPALPYAIPLAGLAVVAIVATLGGIHVRTEEYV